MYFTLVRPYAGLTSSQEIAGITTGRWDGFIWRNGSCCWSHIPFSCHGSRSYSTLTISSFSGSASKAMLSVDEQALVVESEETEVENRIANVLEMERGGCEVEKRTGSSDNNLANIIEILKPKNKFRYHKVPKLKALRLQLDPSLVLQILKHKEVTPLTAWNFFVWAKKQMRYKHTDETYNTMIGILCEIRKFTSIIFLLDDMCKEGVYLTSATCVRMAKAFGSAGLVERAVHSLNHMTRLGTPPTTRQFNSLVNVLLESEHHFKAYIAYKEMTKAGCEPDAHTFKLLLRALARVEKSALACHIFDDMKARGCEPDIETSSLIIGVLCGAARIDDAVLVFKKVKQKGVRMNARVYDTLLIALADTNELEKAVEIYEEMRMHGFNPSASLESLLVTNEREGEAQAVKT